MEKTLQSYTPVSLEQMKAVRLMNRIDTKYVTTLPKLVRLLEMARGQYWVQEIDGQRNMPYYTLYYDTERCDMYLEHLRGRKTRQKIRIRAYEHSGVSFLEVKNKNNKGRTAKKRVFAKPAFVPILTATSITSETTALAVGSFPAPLP